MKSSIATGMMFAAILLPLSLGVAIAQEKEEIPNLILPREMNVTDNLILFLNMTLNVIMIEIMTTITTNLMIPSNVTCAKNVTWRSMTRAALMINDSTI